MALFPAGSQRVAGGLIEDTTYVCRNSPSEIDAEVCRKPTGGSVLGKFAAKNPNERSAPMAARITPRLIELAYEAALKSFWRKQTL